MRSLLLALGFLWFLPACSTFSKRECREMDWFRAGQTAALEGHNIKQAKTPFIDKCQEDHGIPMDSAAFERGFKSGQNQLCTSENLKALEEKGGKYPEACHSDEEAQAIVNPSREQVLKSRVEELERELARFKKENAKLETEVESLRSQVTSCKVGNP